MFPIFYLFVNMSGDSAPRYRFDRYTLTLSKSQYVFHTHAQHTHTHTHMPLTHICINLQYFTHVNSYTNLHNTRVS